MLFDIFFIYSLQNHITRDKYNADTVAVIAQFGRDLRVVKGFRFVLFCPHSAFRFVLQNG